jgi:hypothetical protein
VRRPSVIAKDVGAKAKFAARVGDALGIIGQRKRVGADKGLLGITRQIEGRISDPRIMGFLRNNSIFVFGQADRARTSATVGEILDAMWLFNSKFERALSMLDEMKARKNGWLRRQPHSSE